jgi:hypothetical protein
MAGRRPPAAWSRCCALAAPRRSPTRRRRDRREPARLGPLRAVGSPLLRHRRLHPLRRDPARRADREHPALRQPRPRQVGTGPQPGVARHRPVSPAHDDELLCLACATAADAPASPWNASPRWRSSRCGASAWTRSPPPTSRPRDSPRCGAGRLREIPAASLTQAETAAVNAALDYLGYTGPREIRQLLALDYR